MYSRVLRRSTYEDFAKHVTVVSEIVGQRVLIVSGGVGSKSNVLFGQYSITRRNDPVLPCLISIYVFVMAEDWCFVLSPKAVSFGESFRYDASPIG